MSEYEDFITRVAMMAKAGMAARERGHYPFIRVLAPKFGSLCESQNWRCAYCGVRCERGLVDNGATTDHVKPLSAGGSRRWANEVMACRLCNNSRGNMHSYQYLLLVQEHGRLEAARIGSKQNRHGKTGVSIAHPEGL